MAFEDRFVSLAAIAVAATLGWRTMAVNSSRPTEPPRQARPLRADTLTERVRDVADAIARAEGYFASGEHDGRSLPYRLHNPGALKKPALGAELLPTWNDSGLIVFPTREMGWAALDRQVCLMLTGSSSVYDISDTWLRVAAKYADGDYNWGSNVAARLGVSPGSTLGDVASGAGGDCDSAAP